MSAVKWIKITTNMFEDEKINFIESLPEADAILIIWVKLLTLAGKCNANGFIFLTEKIPYTEEMLAHVFRRPQSVVKLALTTLRRLDMISFEDDCLVINNWEKHQNIAGLERIREQNRLRKQAQRERERLALENKCHVTVTQTSQSNHATDLDLDKERDKDKTVKAKQVNYQQIVDLYHQFCPTLQKVIKLNSNRKTLIRARVKDHGEDGLETLFKKAGASNFLQGINDRAWKANFDWLLKDSNAIKVLEGNYDNRTSPTAEKRSREDFVYAEPPKQDLSKFSFLEEDNHE